MADLYVGLVHYPIYNKRMNVIAGAVTNFDIHDISRTCRTYNVQGYYIIHPLEVQKQIIDKILSYWQEGYGKVYNPDRADALSRVPLWEQELSAGAACMNLLHAAHALGFVGSWITGWAARTAITRSSFSFTNIC